MKPSKIEIAFKENSPGSIFICKALDAFLSKFNLPYLAAPFNLVIIVLFLMLKPEVEDASPSVASTVTEASIFDAALQPNATEEALDTEEQVSKLDQIDWLQVGRGLLLSVSQVREIKFAPYALHACYRTGMKLISNYA